MATGRKKSAVKRKKGQSSAERFERKNLNQKVKIQVLTEAGFKCGNPTCRTILALDLHHMYQVVEGGKDLPENLIALCPTCHALYHRGTIVEEAVYVWKTLLVSLNHAFDIKGIDQLVFLALEGRDRLITSGDGVLQFANLVAAGLATFKLLSNNNNQLVTYSVDITPKGKMLVQAWFLGKRSNLAKALESLGLKID